MLDLIDFIEKNTIYNTSGVFYPVHDITENSDSYTIKLSVPGFQNDEVNVKVTEKGEVLVSGEITGTRDTTMVNRYRYFHKTFFFEDIDITTCSADLENGILAISCTKKEFTTLDITVE